MQEQRFIKHFENKVENTIEEFDLLSKHDKVIVACSGGKDSTSCLYLLNKFGYNVEALIIDLLIGDWSKKNLENIRKFCRDNRIKMNIINIRDELGYSICYIRSTIQSKKRLKNCMICGVIKRWLLNKKARELGATKLATGHNLDDEAQTILMNVLTGNPKLSLGLGPKTGIINDKKFVQRIKPLYFCTNEEVRRYSKMMNFPVLYELCPCSMGTSRGEIKKWLAELEKRYPEVKINIVKNFLKFLPTLRANSKLNEKLKYCKICREPSRNDICKTCELIKILRA